ncbi:nucleolar pre-ribosomal-associated protein 1-like isoform X2 [Asterias rubens]|uniref:nucleolar pre-ribosomal-associated protein 1-like isoform X2 n=1 Tax=Asterias rubens TaxID=7604 RepID=UPI001454F11E|nr:nucleolar pre-ribosomal-associated protein 1-like isoform X2 [Asterias rubens]
MLEAPILMETSLSPNHAGKNSEENDLDGEEPSWEEHHVPEEVDMMERCLKLVQKWPQILELLCQEETSLKDIRVSFETLTEILQYIPESLPEAIPTVLDVIQKILNVYIGQVYRALQGGNPSTVIMAALNLLIAMVAHSQSTAREVLTSFNLQHGVLRTLVNRRNPKEQEDIRGCCIRFAMAFFISADNKVIKQVLTNKDFLKSFFRKLELDRVSNIQLLLITLSQYVVCNPTVSKTEKIHLLNDYTLLQFAALYRWQGPTGAELDTEVQSSEALQFPEVRQLCHQFLMKVTCDLKHGINFYDGTLGLSGKNCNPILLKFLLSLHRANEDMLIQDLVVNILRTCPDLLNPYLTSCKYSFQPMPLPSWFANINLLEKILSGQVVISTALQQANMLCTSYTVLIAMVNTVPTVLTPVLLSQAVKHSNLSVSYHILQVIRLILTRGQGVIQWLRESKMSAETVEPIQSVITQYQQALMKALPEVDTYIGLLNKLLDHPVDGDGSDNNVKKQDSEEALSGKEAKQSVAASDLPQLPKRDNVLLLLFDILSAYQQTIPSSFAQTSYDFSHLPHILKHTEATLQPDIEERAIKMLLGFPEGKLRGFKEVKGESGSTVMLLLKQLTSTPALKVKLLNKFIKETGLFDQAEWEITLWLDKLATLEQNESAHIVGIFYKSLTQVIRNPHPFNDKVIEAMNWAHTLVQKDTTDKSVSHHLSAQPNVLIQAMSCTFDDKWFVKDEHLSEELPVKPQPCSAVLPSALEVFTQLKGQDQRLFSQYISQVILSIIDWQESPESVCYLLHQYTEAEGSNIKAQVCWQQVLQYCSLWLPSQHYLDDLHVDQCSSDETSEDKSKDWRSCLRDSIVQGAELGPGDFKILLQCDKPEVLLMTRQLLMYVNTLQEKQTKNVSAISRSYFNLLQDILKNAQSHTKQNQQAMQTIEDTSAVTSTLNSIPVYAESQDEEWWIDMACLVLQHTLFKACLVHLTGAYPIPLPRQLKSDKQVWSTTLMDSFLKCIQVFKQQLPTQKLEPLLKPFIEASFHSFLHLVTTKKKKTEKKSSQASKGYTVELFKKICLYGEATEINEIIGALIQTLESKDVSMTSTDDEWHVCLLDVLCQLLLIIECNPSMSSGSLKEDDMIPTYCVATLVKIAQKFGNGKLDKVLLKILNEDSKLTAAFTSSLVSTWLDEPSQLTSEVVSLLLKYSKKHRHWFEEWFAQSSRQQLLLTKDVLLPVVVSYCTHSCNSLNAESPMISMLHSVYWRWLQDWLLILNMQHELEPSDQSKMDLLTHLLMHSSKDVTNNLLRTLTTKIQEHQVTYHRFQLQVLQLSVERLVCLRGSESCTKKEQGILQEVMVACLQSLVRIIKGSQSQPSSQLDLHLESTAAVVEYIKKDWLSGTPALNQVWKSFVRNGLKHCYQSNKMIQLLSSLVELMYQPRKCAPNDEIPLKQASTILPLPLLYQIVLSHSKFLPTLLEDSTDAEIATTKESLVLLMLTMVRLEPLCCHKAHYPVLIGAYDPTLSTANAALLMILRQYEMNQASSFEDRPTSWGQVAISKHQSQKALGKSLWQQSTMKEILQQLEPDTLQDSSTHFPLHRKLQIAYDSCTPDIWSHRYDPCFLFPLFSHLLAPECLVDCQQFIESRALALTLAGLSSYDSDMRQAAYHIMTFYLGHLEGARFRGRREVYYLMHCLKNSITEPNMRVPCVLGVFVARAALLMLTPEHFLYPVILQYLLIKPQLQITSVPLFSRLVYSSSFKHGEECSWMVSLLTDGLQDSVDVTFYQRNSVFTTLMAFYQSKLATKQIKDGILQLLDRALDIQDSRHGLTKLLMPSVLPMITNTRSESQQSHPSIVNLLKKMNPVNTTLQDSQSISSIIKFKLGSS